MRYRIPIVVLLAVACQGPPARLVTGTTDTVVVNDLVPVQLPRDVFDASGKALPDTGVRFQWVSGAPVPVSDRGVVHCTQSGDATLRASLGALANTVTLRCRPVHEVRGGGKLHMLPGDSSGVLSITAVDSAGRLVTTASMHVSYDSAIISLKGGRIHARAPGQASLFITIGDESAHWSVSVYEPTTTLDGIGPGEFRAIPVSLSGGEMVQLQLPPSPPTYEVTIMPGRDTLRMPRLTMLESNCDAAYTIPQRRYWCFARQGASVVAYHPKEDRPREEWSGMIAVQRSFRP